MNQRDRQILQIALPAIVTNITVPLLGLVDTAIVGHMGDAAYIGAIAVGSMIFSLVYWVFGFLRMGTSGMTAQAHGRRDLGHYADADALVICVPVDLPFHHRVAVSLAGDDAVVYPSHRRCPCPCRNLF